MQVCVYSTYVTNRLHMILNDANLYPVSQSAELRLPISFFGVYTTWLHKYRSTVTHAIQYMSTYNRTSTRLYRMLRRNWSCRTISYCFPVYSRKQMIRCFVGYYTTKCMFFIRNYPRGHKSFTPSVLKLITSLSFAKPVTRMSITLLSGVYIKIVIDYSSLSVVHIFTYVCLYTCLYCMLFL